MCDRYILVNTLEQIESRFELPKQNILLPPDYHISAGRFVPVITDAKPQAIQFYKFGLTPFWSKKEMVLINARAEGDANADNRPDFKGAKGIIQKPAFRKPIRSQRCLVLASAYFSGTREPELLKPYLVYLRNHNSPFAMAGIWDTWINPSDGETINSFSIITTTANHLMQKIAEPRMPVILTRSQEKKWLNPNTELSRITAMLNYCDSKLMNAYPIDPRIYNPAENDRQLIRPVGNKVLTEDDIPLRQTINTSGWNHHKKRPFSNEPLSTMAERSEQSRDKEK